MTNLRPRDLGIASRFVLTAATVLALTVNRSQAASPGYCTQYARLAVHDPIFPFVFALVRSPTGRLQDSEQGRRTPFGSAG